MNCHATQRIANRYIDGELESVKKIELESHVKNCLACRKYISSIQSINKIMAQSIEHVQPSKNFDALFWEKISNLKRKPWPVDVLDFLIDLVPSLTLKQAVAFATMAFFIGNLGGAASIFGAKTEKNINSYSPGHFSLTQEFKGIPDYSLTANYLKITDPGASQ